MRACFLTFGKTNYKEKGKAKMNCVKLAWNQRYQYKLIISNIYTHQNIDIYVYSGVSMHTYMSLLCSQRGLESMTPSNNEHTHCDILVSKHHHPIKVYRAPRRCNCIWAGTEKIQDESGTSYGSRKWENTQKRQKPVQRIQKPTWRSFLWPKLDKSEQPNNQ